MPDNSPQLELHPIPSAVNLILAAGLLGINIVLFWILPAALLPRSGWWTLLLPPLVLLSNSCWYVIHESFHGSLLPASQANALTGRLLCVFFGAPWGMVRFFHLMHHAHNRCSIDAPEIYDPAETSFTRATIVYYLRLCGGLYFSELFAPLSFFLPKERLIRCLERLSGKGDSGTRAIIAGAVNQIRDDKVLLQLRIDSMIVYALICGSLMLYGQAWTLLAAALVLRGFLISVADNAPHYGTSSTERRFAKNLRLPFPINWVFLHFNLHGLHHEDPSVPWIHLAGRYEARFNSVPAETWMHAALSQFKGLMTAQTVEK